MKDATPPGLEEAYRQLAADEESEREALAWIEATFLDAFLDS